MVAGFGMHMVLMYIMYVLVVVVVVLIVLMCMWGRGGVDVMASF